jgi:phosphohistidine swiveling domain-containing protein
LLNDIQKAGFKIVTHDIIGNWAEMNEQRDLAHFILGTKAETLQRIKPILKKSKVYDQVTTSFKDWKNDPKEIIEKIKSKFRGQSLIIRSSTVREDGWETANAGAFDTKMNIECDDEISLNNAIEEVFQSFKKDFISMESQVLIQPFVKDVEISGVLFTCDLITGAPYYIINYDDKSGLTDTITSGRSNIGRTLVILRNEFQKASDVDPRLVKIVNAAQEIEQLLGYDKLDIEFAIDSKDQCFTFQIRPITVSHKSYQIDEDKFELNLKNAQMQFRVCQKKSPNILGNYTVFSRMTDWNPAEIIGMRPNALAINLYNHIITEEIWADQRSQYGYRDIRPTPLVYNFCAQPYVDCRASINSFIPSVLSEDCASRLVDAYLNIIKKNPFLHDKLELDIVFTIWTPTFNEDAKKRFNDENISLNDIASLETALKNLTAKALLRLDSDISSINSLVHRFNTLMDSNLGIIDKIYQLIEDCRMFGTPAFAHAARAGFVAVTLLKSLVKLGYLTHDRMLQFQESIQTVTSDFQSALFDNNFSEEEILKQFGHLRPGTYDVNQSAYWENPNFYLSRGKQSSSTKFFKKINKNKFSFTDRELQGIQIILNNLPTNLKNQDLIDYFSTAIQAREKTKFQFTRNLSAALDLIIEYGKKNLNLTREEIGYLTFDDIKGLRTNILDDHLIQNFVKLRKSDFIEKHHAKLPSYILNEKDFIFYEQEKSEANFITRKNIIGELIFINTNRELDFTRKIIIVPNADPGFDWIFSHNIAGLITQYGGANSHMAIRCAELGIPAAIGIGEKVYESLHEGRLMLDCQKGIIEHV